MARDMLMATDYTGRVSKLKPEIAADVVVGATGKQDV
jgi:hypothetical protein